MGYQQSLRPNLIHGMVIMVMVDMDTDILIDTGMDIIEERDLPMPNLKLMPQPKLNHGTILVTMATHTHMVDITDMVATHTDMAMDTTEARDLPMLNQKLHQKPSHGTVIVDIMDTGTHTDTDMDIDTGVKP